MSGNQNSKPTVFITYNWEDASELLIKDLNNSIGKYVNLVYDKKDVHNWDSLSKFMQTIKEKDFVVQIISKKYLESVNCMFEVTQLMERPEWSKHVFSIVLQDAFDIYNDHKKIKFVRYWVKDCEKMEKELATIPDESRSGLEENLNKRKTISKKMGEFLNFSADPMHPKAVNATEAIKETIFKAIGLKEDEIIENIGGKEKEIIHFLWEKIPSIRNEMRTIDSLKSDCSKLKEVNDFKEKVHSLFIDFESKKQYLQKNSQTALSNLIDCFSLFADQASCLCAKNGEIKIYERTHNATMIAKCGATISQLTANCYKAFNSVSTLYSAVEKLL